MEQNVFSRYGFLFENGVNLGVLACLNELQSKSKMKNGNMPLVDIYNEYLTGLNRHKVLDIFMENSLDRSQRENIENFANFFIYTGFIRGRYLFQEFLKREILLKKDDHNKVEVIYFQADFLNAFEQNNKEEYFKNIYRKQFGEEMLSQTAVMEFRKGGFLRADTLVLLKKRKKYYLFVADESISKKGYMQNFGLPEHNDLKSILIEDYINKKKAGNFHNLSIDSSLEGLNVGERLYNYAIGSGISNKPLNKMMQAGSYGYSFLSHLLQIGKITESDFKNLNVYLLGITQDDYSCINLGGEDVTTDLKAFYNAYKSGDNQSNESSYEQKKDKVSDVIVKNYFRTMKYTDKDFYGINEKTGQEFRKLDDTFEIQSGENRFTFYHQLSNFQNTEGEYKGDTFRNKHKDLVTEHLTNKETSILFLSGNPGIGKTTSLVSILTEDNKNGFLFFYISPRKQVNEDILEKFCQDDGKLKHDQMIFLTTSGTDASRDDNGKPISCVNFKANNPEDIQKLSEKNLVFKNMELREEQKHQTGRHFHSMNDQTIRPEELIQDGVLSRLCNGIAKIQKSSQNNVIKNNKIIATCAIQSYKDTNGGNTVKKHLPAIFNAFYNVWGCAPIAAAKYFQNISTVYFMIDEITGDSAGAKFYDEVKHILFHEIYENLEDAIKEKIQFKLIVADASLNNTEVISKHLGYKREEYNKIYFSARKAVQEEKWLSVETFEDTSNAKNFERAVCINTNSYPADSLQIEYKLFLDAHPYRSEKDFFCRNLTPKVDLEMLKYAFEQLEEGYLGNEKIEQVILYIQDKKRLVAVEEALKNQGKEKNVFYIKFDASNSSKEREQNIKNMNQCKLVLMTSSASRGLSFKKSSLIIVDVCSFSLEQNLMEDIQLIYRSRGGRPEELRKNKKIIFYLCDSLVYEFTGEDYNKEKAFQKKKKDVFTFLTLLHGCIMTRIYGSFVMKGKQYSLIPVSGISSSVPFSQFIESMAQLYKDVKNEYNRNRDERIAKLLDVMEDLFNHIKISTNAAIYEREFENMQQIHEKFVSLWNKSYYSLLYFKPFHDFYIYGNIGIFPIKGSAVEANTLINPSTLNKYYKDNWINGIIDGICKDPEVNDDLRIAIKKFEKELYQIYKKTDEYDKSQNILESSSQERQYIALSFISPFFQHNGTKEQDENSMSVRQCLEQYIKTRYSIDNVLPITEEYEDVAYLKFQSSSIEPLRNQVFSKNYLFYSPDVNLLNLLLSQEC